MKFYDDLPGEAVILDSEAVITGTFNCNPPSDLSQQKVRMVLNDNYVDNGKTFTPNTGGCWCPNCATSVSIPLTKEELRAHYYINNMNAVKFSVQTVTGASDTTTTATTTNNNNNNNNTNDDDDNFICVSECSLNVHYEIPDIIVNNISPTAGPTSGNTQVTVTGINFSPYLDMYCVVGNTPIPALYVSNTTMLCATKNELPGLTFFGIGVKIYGRLYFSNTTFKYHVYTDVVLDKVDPARVPPGDGNKVIALSGNFAPTNTYTCLFNSPLHAEDVTVKGTLTADRRQIHCTAPKWPRSETVDLSVSLNGQQYSQPLPFTFAQKGTKINIVVSITSVSVSIVIIAGAAIFGYLWVRHHRKSGKYQRIKDGNAQAEINEISMGKRIGKGTMGEVYKGTWRGTPVAIKKVSTEGMGEDTLRSFEQDIRFMQDLRSPSIAQFMSCAFEGNAAYIITEYMPRGSLYAILHAPSNSGSSHKRRKSREYGTREDTISGWPMMLRMLADAARGMTYLHTCRPPVVHKNLKSSNLLVDEFWRVKVSDYNLSSVTIMLLENETKGSDEEIKRLRETRSSPISNIKRVPSRLFASLAIAPWAAPEVLEKFAFSTKSDVYSFGIVMWECLTKEVPYEGVSVLKTMYAVLNNRLRPAIPDYAPPEYAELIRQCWDDDPESRPTFSVILEKLNEMATKNWDNKPWGKEKIPSPFSSSSPLTSTISPSLAKAPRTPQPQISASVPSYTTLTEPSETSHLLK